MTHTAAHNETGPDDTCCIVWALACFFINYKLYIIACVLTVLLSFFRFLACDNDGYTLTTAVSPCSQGGNKDNDDHKNITLPTTTGMTREWQGYSWGYR
jgi:hypothetical protein